ncbi:rCG49912 [Rattus norvegicus]|uniref:RCG49912 n=1 Tax=Rattus norvegicus TaxID=10116 RepID=A6K502_RAT|nr:rCG49912 [Rattus norvegicus]
MFARIPGKGITLEMYIRNKVNKKKYKKKENCYLIGLVR